MQRENGVIRTPKRRSLLSIIYYLFFIEVFIYNTEKIQSVPTHK